MKQIKYILLALLVLAACSRNDEPMPANLVRVSSVEVLSPGGHTRATGDDGSAVTGFQAGDVIDITAYQGTGMQTTTLTASAGAEGLSWALDKEVYINLTGNLGIEASYVPNEDTEQPADDGLSRYFDRLYANANAANGCLSPKTDGTAGVRLNFKHWYNLVEVTTLTDTEGKSLSLDIIENVVLYFNDAANQSRKVKLNAAHKVIVPMGVTLTAIEITPRYQPTLTATFADGGKQLDMGQHLPLSITLYKHNATVQPEEIIPWGSETTTAHGEYDYIVRTPKDLVDLSKAVNDKGMLPGTNIPARSAKVIQLANVDMSGVTNWVPIGGTVGNYAFLGTYNGNGYTISNLSTPQGYTGLAGLFSWVGADDESPALLYNIHLRNCDIHTTDDAGALAGSARNAIIAHCSATGSVTADAAAGGLIGSLSINSHLTRSRSACVVTSTAERAGGLVGINSSSTIAACTASGAVTGYSATGGLVGDNPGPIYGCYATGHATVTGTDWAYAGGLVGYNNSTISNCYATGTATGATAGTFAGYNSGGTFTACHASGTSPGVPVGNGGSAGITTIGLPNATVRAGANPSGIKTIQATGTSLSVVDYTATPDEVFTSAPYPAINYDLSTNP